MLLAIIRALYAFTIFPDLVTSLKGFDFSESPDKITEVLELSPDSIRIRFTSEAESFG